MKKLFLTSSIGTPGVAESIRSRLGTDRTFKTAFITTPVEVEDMTDDKWYRDDRSALRESGFDFFDYSISGKSESNIQTDLAGIEALYISGGNEFWLKHQSNKCNFSQFVHKFVESGKIYLGTSAGSIIMAPDMTPTLVMTPNDSLPENIIDHSGFSVVDFVVIPHWGSKEFATRKFKQLSSAYLVKWKLILLNNFQYVHVIGDWYRVVDVRREK